MEAHETQDGLQEEVPESLDQPMESHHEEAHSEEGKADHDDLPKGVKERLARQERKHQREMREMRSALESMHSQHTSRQNEPNENTSLDNLHNPSNQGGMEDQIHKAVSYALQHKENEERKAKEAEQAQHVYKQYGELDKHLNQIADKYDDFDDVVRGDLPFTSQMRDVALMLPKKGAGSAGEVLYKLGKNPDELHRISKLHPLDQASEMIKLSHLLMNGEEKRNSSPNQLSQIKSMPVMSSRSVNEKTPISELRRRMNQGWK